MATRKKIKRRTENTMTTSKKIKRRRTDNTMITSKKIKEGQTIQWPQVKRSKDRQHNGHKKKD